MAAPVINVTEKPQFMAINTARVAPITDRAPFMPHAHGTRAESRAAIRRMPAGKGIPISTPAGVIRRTVSAMRWACEALIAARMIGRQRDDTENRDADDAQEDELDGAPQRGVADAAADEAADAGAEQHGKQRDGQRVDRMAEQQHEPLQQRHLDEHEAGAQHAEVSEPARPVAAAQLAARQQRAGRQRTA